MGIPKKLADPLGLVKSDAPSVPPPPLPEAPKPTPPRYTPVDSAGAAFAATRGAAGMSSNIITGPLGLKDAASISNKQLLGA